MTLILSTSGPSAGILELIKNSRLAGGAGEITSGHSDMERGIDMRTQQLSIFAAAVLLAVWCTGPAFADVSLASVISDNMVLQRGKPVPIWGWADPGEKVTVKLGKQSQTATADANGDWMVKFKAMKAGGPYKMTVAGKNEISIGNILVGEVWVCSGQSNMQWDVRNSDNAKQEIAAANYPNIRLFSVPRITATKPQKDTPGSWEECSPETVARFSAIGYFFGRNLHQELNVPIGLINTSWGGTIAEAWTSMPTLEKDPDFKPILDRGEQSRKNDDNAVADFEHKFQEWKEQTQKALEDGTHVPNSPQAPRNPYTSPNRPSVLYKRHD